MLSAVRAVIWPTRLKNPPRLFGRLGRVLHWFCVGFGALIALTPHGGGIGLAFLIFAVGAMIGRAIRYILSAE